MESSAFGRLLGALVAPTRTFTVLREKPSWVVALLVLIGLGVGLGVLMSGKIDWVEVTRDAIEARGTQMSEEDVERVIDLQEKMGPIMLMVGPLVVAPLGFMLASLIFMVVSKMLGGELAFQQSLATFVHGLMPRAVGGLLSVPVILGRDGFSAEELQTGSVLTSNLASLAPEGASPAVVSLLSSVDVFSIWALVLLILGYSVVARVSRGAAAGGVIVVWLVYVLGKAGLATLGG